MRGSSWKQGKPAPISDMRIAGRKGSMTDYHSFTNSTLGRFFDHSATLRDQGNRQKWFRDCVCTAEGRERSCVDLHTRKALDMLVQLQSEWRAIHPKSFRNLNQLPLDQQYSKLISTSDRCINKHATGRCYNAPAHWLGMRHAPKQGQQRPLTTFHDHQSFASSSC
jgi:hypothetical protein